MKSSGRKWRAGPFHPAFGYLVKSEAFCLAVLARHASSGFAAQARVSVNRRDVPHITGYKRANLKRLAASGIAPGWTEGEGIEEGCFAIESGGRMVEGSLTDALSALTPG